MQFITEMSEESDQDNNGADGFSGTAFHEGGEEMLNAGQHSGCIRNDITGRCMRKMIPNRLHASAKTLMLFEIII